MVNPLVRLSVIQLTAIHSVLAVLDLTALVWFILANSIHFAVPALIFGVVSSIWLIVPSPSDSKQA